MEAEVLAFEGKGMSLVEGLMEVMGAMGVTLF